MGGFNVGGFASGLQSGLATGVGIRKSRQDEKLRELIQNQLGDEGFARKIGMEALGDEATDLGMEDPFALRLWNRMTGRDATMVAPEDDPANDAQAGAAPAGQFRANGGAIRRYAYGGSVYGAGPQMTGNPDPRTSAPMGGLGAGGGLRQAPIQQPTMQPMYPQPVPRTAAPMGYGQPNMPQQMGGGMQQMGGMQRPPIALGAPGMGGYGGGGPKMVGGGGGFQQPVQPPMGGMGRAALPRQPMAGQPYAEGGDVTDEEEIRRRAAKNRERKPSRVEGRTEEARGADRTAKPEPKAKAPKAPKEPGPRSALGRGADKLSKVEGGSMLGNAGRAIGRGAAVLGIAGAGAGGVRGALDAGETSDAGISADHYLQPGEETSFGKTVSDPEFWRDIGNRSWGATKGAVKGLFNPIDAITGGGDFADQQALAGQSSGPPPAPRSAIGEAGAGGGVSVGGPAPDRPPPPPEARLQPRGPVGPPAPQQIDFTGRSPQEVPNFKTEDWVKHREVALRQMVARGVPLTDAMERVDQQVTGMQQRGFTNYAMQGLALLKAGDTSGASSALRAAFQYFPSGSDVKFGAHNGQLFGIGIDEKTGKTVGQPYPITPESISAIVDNFRQPGAWNVWAKDQRDFQQLMRKYEEIDKPYSEAISSAALTNADANVGDAQARLQAAAQGGGSGVGGGTDRRTANKYFTDEYMNIEGLDVNPELARGLASVSMQIWDMNGGRVPPAQILEAVSRAAKIPDPQQRAQFFARLGVTDPTGYINEQ